MRRKDSGAPPPGAWDTALGLLSRREHSRRDLKRKLTQRGIESADADDALERLERSAYQSDQRFAEAVVRQRAAAGYGPRHILAELAGHGIAATAVRPLLDEHDWDAIATDLVRRRARRTAGDAEAARRRLVGLLQRRGFGGDHIRRALAVIAAGADSEVDPDAD
jgi:regulatory protein